MNPTSSRRNFLAAGLALPVAATASRSAGPQQQPAPPARAASSSPALQYRTLGKTGLKVTTVGFGCMITSDASVITRAADMGINYFDTCRSYQHGQNERMVGAALGAKRKDVFLSSKCDSRTADGILAELDTSLKELNTDHLDVWLLHMKDSPSQVPDELVEAQRKAKQQGKTRFIGLSTHNLPEVVDRILEAKLDVVQPQYNFASAATWGPALEKLNQAGVGLVAMKVMARAGGRGQSAPQRPANFAPAALKWAIKNSAIATTVPSMTDMDQLDQNFKVMAEKFSDDDAKILSARLEEIGPYFCRMCGECAGQCPKGLQVSDMVRFTMYADGYGQFALGRDHFQQMPAAHQQVRCGDCADCPVHCPHGVKVVEQLSRAQELFA
ncbi:MAG: aldo/keto reductase [Bryobacteraceae bacterium]|jgi:aryl-alcohol dehydrogenase-like predicted oxidoreductase